MIGVMLVIGLFLGGFANLCIERLPQHRSILKPAPACPACDKPIAPLDLLPLVGFAITGGRCRHCSAPIPRRRPLVELATGLLVVAAYGQIGLTWRLPIAVLLVVTGIIAGACDLEQRIVPNALTLPGILAALILALPAGRFLDSLYGLLACGGAFLIIGLIGAGKLGGGDVKLAALIGATLGLQAGLTAIFLGIIAGGAFSLWLLITKLGSPKSSIPFAPFLAGAAVATLLIWSSLGPVVQQTMRW